MSKVLVYARCSTAAQGEKHSIPAQMATCATFAAANGLSIVDVYVDTGVSGSVSPWAREGLSAALKRCEDEGLNLLVAKLDRLSRSVMDSLAVEKDLNRHELEVFSASEPNGKSPELELLRGIIRNFAQFERARCQSRIKEGLAAARAKGVRLGRPTAGFAKDELGRWVKSEDYRRVLLALAMRGEGRKLREIAAVTGWKAPMISKLVKRYQNVDGLEAYAAELGL